MKRFFEYLKFFVSRIFSNKVRIKGKCKSCGECCRTIVFYVGKDSVKTEEQFELLKKWDKKYNNFEIAGSSKDGALYFKCKALKDNGKCGVYHFRSIACRLYPKYNSFFFTRGEGLKTTCGYYLEKDKDFNDFLKTQQKEIC